MTSHPGVYSDTRVAGGPLLFISGQVPTAADGTVPADTAEQTRLVLAKIEGHLMAHDLDWAAVVKVTYFLRDIDDLQSVRETLLDTIPPPRPAASLVEVSNLIDSRFRIEIEAVADLGLNTAAG